MKHLQWAQEHLSDGFDNVIWTDAKRAGRKGAATGHESLFIVLFSDESFCDRFRTVCPFRLNGWGVSYNGKGRSVFVSFRKNGTITLYCLILYVWVGGARGVGTLWVLVCGSVLGLWVSGSVYIVHANAQSTPNKTSHMHTRLLTHTLTYIYIRTYICTYCQ